MDPRRHIRKWGRNGFAMPAPSQVKWSVLERYGHPTGIWVESGTFLGDTARHLATTAAHVYTIEPSPALAIRARERFAEVPNVTVVEGLSEECLVAVLELVDGPLSLWLDGHYSEGVTFQGPRDTPIREELAALSPHLERLGQVTVLIDDARCFDPAIEAYAQYPPRDWLVHWALANDLTWTIEHDIFAMWK